MSKKELIFCPLECGVRIKDIFKHIQKCKNKNLLGVKYVQCEFNKYHIIRNELYETHLFSCSSKKKFEEDENESIDDNLSDKFKDESDEENKKEEEKKEEQKNNSENINDENNINKKRRRYRHERALFKNEEEIDQECLEFFNKVYI